VVPVLLNACFSLPPTSHPMLLNTTAQMLGNLQDWLQVNQQYLGAFGRVYRSLDPFPLRLHLDILNPNRFLAIWHLKSARLFKT
jgi:hypothetical protein